MNRLILPAALALTLASCGTRGVSVPPISSDIKPQDYTWYPKRATTGPVVVVVSIPRQEADVYRNGVRIGRAAVSTGRAGHETPTGVFQILQKDVDHHSSTYGDAPMPYMERLTWDGVALHTGYNPGKPDSHGCVRLPDGFARELFKITRLGGTVVITNRKTLPTMGLAGRLGVGQSGGGGWSGLGKAATTSVIISTRDREAVVYQDGKKAASTPVEVRGGLSNLSGELAFMYAGGQKWRSVEGDEAVKGLAQDLSLPAGFREKLQNVMQPGSTLVITSEPLTTGNGVQNGVLAN